MWDLIRIECIPCVNWKAYEAILTLVQEFWLREQKIGMQADEWYMNYVRFLAALKKQTYKMERKRKIPTSIASLSYSEAKRSEKSEE